MRVLDLFSGIGGFSLGLERAGMTTVAFCEIEPYCRRVLAKHWPGVPCYGDIRELDGKIIGCDVVAGGFPCQPFSVAGEQRGKADDRNLWPEMLRVIAEARPAWVIGENVPGIIRMELDQVLSDLEGIGYAWRAFVIPACAVAAEHRRDRVWVVAHASRYGDGVCGDWATVHNGNGNSPSQERERHELESRIELRGPSVADANRERQQGSGKPQSYVNSETGGDWETTEPLDGGKPREWEPEPCVDRVVDGLPDRMDRLAGLGNAVVPQIPEIIGRAIMGLS